jgi:hypothetical protein
LQAPHQLEFTLASICIYAIGVPVILPWIVGPKRWQGTRLLTVSILSMALAAYFLETIRDPLSTFDVLRFNVGEADTIGLSLFGFALAFGLGSACATSSSVCAYLISYRRAYRLFPREIAVTFAARLLRDLATCKPGIPGYKKDVIIRDLNVIVKCLRMGPVDSQRVFDPIARKAVRRRFESAAHSVVKMQQDVALEQHSTIQDVTATMNRLCAGTLMEMYHYLPDISDSDTSLNEAQHRSLLSRTAHIIRRVGIGVAPISVLGLTSALDISLPDSVRQWATGISLIWLLVSRDSDFFTLV